MSEIKDKEIQQASGGWGEEVPMVGPYEKGIPGAKVNNMSLACEYFLKKQAAISDAKHCGLCQFFTAIPSRPTYGQCGCPSAPKVEFEAHELV